MDIYRLIDYMYIYMYHFQQTRLCLAVTEFVLPKLGKSGRTSHQPKGCEPRLNRAETNHNSTSINWDYMVIMVIIMVIHGISHS